MTIHTSKKPKSRSRIARIFCAAALSLAGAGAAFALAGGEVPPFSARIDTQLIAFFQPGSQPTGVGEVVYDPFPSSTTCRSCHEEAGAELIEIYAPYQGSMMAQSARDPMFHAALAIANQDAAFAGDVCLRCHTPGGWLSGRSEPPDGSSLVDLDRDGVGCNICHRMVDPVFKEGISPAIDQPILANINPLPINPGSGNFIMDPEDVRRGPYDTVVNVGHVWSPSPFHRTSELCATCHDVSNPVYMRNQDDTYSLTSLDAPHPTGDKYDMFPFERTYSEWLHSDFAKLGGIDMGGRFGGQKTVVSTCQDCHMPQTTGKGCTYAVERDDLASHEFVGGNAWAQDMIANLYPNEVNTDYLDAGKQAAVDMLQRAATLELTQAGNQLVVRIINETGHKLPTGYPEGRRMWISVELLDDAMQPLATYGAYDFTTADLTRNNTKVYEIELGMDETVAAAAGLSPGKSFHFVLNNVVMKDNRIPPRGFTNEAFREVQAAPASYSYADGQYWDDTPFRLRLGTAAARVRLYYQSASKEYVTFLRDENETDLTGDILYEQWELTGKSPPVEMAFATTSIEPFPIGDVTGDDRHTAADFFAMWACLTDPQAIHTGGDCAAFDFDTDGDVDLDDFAQSQQIIE